MKKTMLDYKSDSDIFSPNRKNPKKFRWLLLLFLIIAGGSIATLYFLEQSSNQDLIPTSSPSDNKRIKIPLPLPQPNSNLTPLLPEQPSIASNNSVSLSILEALEQWQQDINIDEVITKDSIDSLLITTTPQEYLHVESKTTVESDTSIVATTTLSQKLSQSQYKEYRYTIKAGDTLSNIFQQWDLSTKQLFAIINVKPICKKLVSIRPGQTLYAKIDDNQRLQQLDYHFDQLNFLQIRQQQSKFQAEIIKKPVETRIIQATGTVGNSLFLSAQNAGLSDAIIMKLVHIFAWDIDFALDIRTGDQFSVIYQQYYIGNKKIKDGHILAVEFINQNKSYQAIRYTDPENQTGYYTPNGHNLHKAFLRTPVKFSRISSYFNPNRWHPILHKIKAHNGVDYAAPTGTPIKVTANGKVIFKGYKGGYGNTIIVQHSKNIETLYAHLSKFHHKLKVGQAVKQGQIIGYVGKTGRATGPHLHYEFHLNGKYQNPLTVKLPKTMPLAQQYLQDFKQKSAPLLAELAQLRQTKVVLKN